MSTINMIHIENLTYEYPDGYPALRGVTLNVEKGMRMALAGKNGAGKSTLLLHIAGLLDGEGVIEVAGLRRSPKTIAAIRNRIGFLFSQVEYQFIMPDVLNDVMLGVSKKQPPADDASAAAMEWLRRFDIEKYARRNPLDLSSGEMKRAALAGIMSGEPDILLMDEPLNNLDRENSQVLVNLLRDQDTTMLFSTHRDFLVTELATHCAVMEEGRITMVLTGNEFKKSRALRDLVF
ncbi:MAG TPA: ABC transporter ATP-binding protein [Spirochaetota bacterium]|nr:ABC transporter ATP-binding protein [Spirochaetota bacterium]